nr:MAG TPA: hypothetical protein [Caudoviricetes sp.]
MSSTTSSMSIPSPASRFCWSILYLTKCCFQAFIQSITCFLDKSSLSLMLLFLISRYISSTNYRSVIFVILFLYCFYYSYI